MCAVQDSTQAKFDKLGEVKTFHLHTASLNNTLFLGENPCLPILFYFEGFIQRENASFRAFYKKDS